MKSAMILAGLVLAAPVVAVAANANHPYSNIDHRVDAGNNTGDSQVEQLNQAQLSGPGQPRAYGTAQARPYAGYSAPRPVAPGYQTPYPPVAYAAPAYPYGYYPPPGFVAVPRPYFVRPFFYPYY